jgi:hypothetical protein
MKIGNESIAFSVWEAPTRSFGKLGLKDRLELAPWEFSVSDSQEIVELVCKSGHKVLVSAATIRIGRQLWCAKCGADLHAEDGQPPDAADDARRNGRDKRDPHGLRSVPDPGQSR